jgi:hypothetical protein
MALLEELRQRIRSEYAPPEPTSAERLATFGRGVLSNRGSFLDNLTAGIAAQDQAAAARAEQQRRALDMERQVVENAIREQLERDRLAQSASQFEAEGPTREARIRQINAEIARGNLPSFTYMRNADGTGVVAVDTRDPSRRIPVPGVVLQNDRTVRDEMALRQNARNQAQLAAEGEARRRELLGSRMSPEDLAAFRRTTEEQLLASIGLTPLPGAGTTPTPQGPQPSRVLPYDGPAAPAAPAAPRTGPRISAQPQQPPSQ